MTNLNKVAMVSLAPLAATLASLAGWLLAKTILAVFLATGLGFATFTGVDAGLNSLAGYISSQFTAIPSGVSGVVGLTRLDDAISVIVSAWVWRVTFIVIAKPWKLVFLGFGNS